MDLDELLKKIRDYYKDNCKQLVFVGEKKLSTNNNCKMYFLDVEEEVERLNYQKVFQEYLVFYIRNRDQLISINGIRNAKETDELALELKKAGLVVHNNPGIYPQTDEKKSGIYGELFNDFYLNIVKEEEVLMTYSVRSSFNLPNVKGVDLVATSMSGDELTLIFSEAKFVNTIYSASDALADDIKGKDETLGHITSEYINEYTSFFMNKSHSLYFDEDNTRKIMGILTQLNNLLLNEGMSPIEAMNTLGIRIRFDFFAIYQDNHYDADERKKYFDKVVDTFNDNILETGIEKYDIEVVFIPTKNASTTLKAAIETWD